MTKARIKWILIYLLGRLSDAQQGFLAIDSPEGRTHGPSEACTSVTPHSCRCQTEEPTRLPLLLLFLGDISCLLTCESWLVPTSSSPGILLQWPAEAWFSLTLFPQYFACVSLIACNTHHVHIGLHVIPSLNVRGWRTRLLPSTCVSPSTKPGKVLASGDHVLNTS